LDTQQTTTFADDSTLMEYSKPMISKDLQWLSMGDESRMHSIKDILSRPVLIKQGEFISTPLSAELGGFKFKFPDVILQKSPNVVDKLNYFAYFRANVCVRLLINATPFMSGRYWMFFAPFDSTCNRQAMAKLGTSFTPGTDIYFPNVTGYPGVEIDLASNSPAQIKIPYCAPLSHYNLVSTRGSMGECFIVPLNLIKDGSSSIPAGSGASYSVYAWFEDIDLAMPTSAPVTVPTLDSLPRAQIGSEESATTSKPISEVANGVATTARLMSDVPVFGPAARVVDWVSTAVSGAASTFGWNKPTDMAKLESFAPIPAKGYTNANGIDNSVKLSAMPDNGLTYSDSVFSSKVDEMDITYIAKKSSIFTDTITWSSGALPEAILNQFPVAPGILNNKYVGNPTNIVYPTTLGYLASMFSFWRGGLTYRLTVAKTAFHTGRLRITYHAGISSGASVNSTFQNAYNWVLDLSVSSEISFTVPYVSNVPWKHVVVGKESDFAGKEPTMTGFITIEVLTALRRASDSVAASVPINIWISGADDIAFAVPNFGDYAVYSYPVAPTSLDDEDLPRAQIFNQTTSATSHNEQVQDDSVKVFEAPPLSLTGFEQLSIGEKITNLRQVIKRFCIMNYSVPFPYMDAATGAYIGGLDHSSSTYLFNQITLDPAYFGEATDIYNDFQSISFPTTRSSVTGAISTLDYTAMIRFKSMHPLYRVSYLFRFYRGGLRYKVVSIPSLATQCTTQGFAVSTDAVAHDYTNVIDGVNVRPTRSALPTFAVRDHAIVDNGVVARPVMDTFLTLNNMQRFEHLAASDLNNVLEFEVPYYNSIPISVVTEGNLGNADGPLVRRNKVYLRRSHDPTGLDTPITDFQEERYGPVIRPKLSTATTSGGVTRATFGGAYVYQAAADDFSFGYLVGPPALYKIPYD
jgi:hypothetical protein